MTKRFTAEIPLIRHGDALGTQKEKSLVSSLLMVGNHKSNVDNATGGGLMFSGSRSEITKVEVGEAIGD